MKSFEDYGNPNENKVTALVLIDILNCLERIEKGLHVPSANIGASTPARDIAKPPSWQSNAPNRGFPQHGKAR